VHVAEVQPVLMAQAPDWDALVEAPGPILVETRVSARWQVPLRGLVDLKDPRAAELEDGPHPIVLPVTLLHHPDKGLLVVDTGIDRELAAGERGPVRGVIRMVLGKLEPVEPLSEMVARYDAPLIGVLLTHTHLDHVLGLPDVPAGTRIYTGEGELRARDVEMALMRSTYRQLFEGVTLHVLSAAHAVPLGELTGWDLLGDGSLWALSVPGHTPGSLAFLARTPEGPVLMVGDNSHTRWGWEHGVPPGNYTEDPEGNKASLAKLKALAERHPQMQVIVGHEL
jgi:glyoxylase-like metal-dependent hydrolase (beta-lactamase superfamily II)